MDNKKVAQILNEHSPKSSLLEQMSMVPSSLIRDNKSVGGSSSFIEGNTDRFGSQIHPINPHLNVPGPGSYKSKESIEDRANKVLVIEEQRKLLKQVDEIEKSGSDTRQTGGKSF